MLKVLINSYTCCPNMGSEPGMGWNWITNLASHCELYVISEGEYREPCERWCAEHPDLGLHIHWYWNPVPQSTRDKCWNQGNWSFYPLYQQWQKTTADIAREICKSERIDILHQLNMIGFREPGYLWQVSKETQIPFIWGPVDAKDRFPMAYAMGSPLRMRLFLQLKNAITLAQLRFSRRVAHAVAAASCVLSASSNSVRTLKKYFGIDSPLMNETGTYPMAESSYKKENSDYFDILWVGKADFRKQLGIAIKCISKLQDEKIRLHVVGACDVPEVREFQNRNHGQQQIIQYGNVSHDQVLQMMRKSDLFFFTSVAEGTPHAVLEAIGCGLPVLCFDTCGQGDCVTEDVGMKISLSNPDQSVLEFAEKIIYLSSHREELESMAKNCRKRSEELSWENKAKQMVGLYENVIKDQQGKY